MKTLILAAGYATRLYPLTENFPKPLLKVQGKTILDWLIDDIAAQPAMNDFIVISNHRFQKHFLDWAATRPQSITILDDGTSSNETRLGAVRDIQFAIESMHLDDDLFVIAGDNLLDFSLASFLQYARSKHSSCVLRYYEADEKRLLKSGVLTIDDKDRVTFMTEKSPTPATHWVCPAFYIYSRSDAKLVKQALQDGCGADAPGSFIAWLCQHSPVHAMLMPGARYDIGTLESYQKICESYQGLRK